MKNIISNAYNFGGGGGGCDFFFLIPFLTTKEMCSFFKVYPFQK